MASTYSTDISLEKITTGEKAGLWGTITNTNLEILEQAATGYTTVDMASGNVTLSLADGTTANGKNLYLKLTGTLAGDRTLTMPATTTGGTATRVFIVEDATVRGTSNRTLSVLTTGSASSVPVPTGSKLLLVSDGTDTTIGIMQKGYNSISDSNAPYLAVAGDQLICSTNVNPFTVNLPASPSVGDEVTIIDALATFSSNNLTINPNGSNLNSAAGNLVLSTAGQAITLVYLNSTRGWSYKNT
tara:strand:- start:1796 stop:2527 length:732 start_codon:yes stop_codon:yes gene_type:complete